MRRPTFTHKPKETFLNKLTKHIIQRRIFIRRSRIT